MKLPRHVADSSSFPTPDELFEAALIVESQTGFMKVKPRFVRRLEATNPDRHRMVLAGFDDRDFADALILEAPGLAFPVSACDGLDVSGKPLPAYAGFLGYCRCRSTKSAEASQRFFEASVIGGLRRAAGRCVALAGTRVASGL